MHIDGDKNEIRISVHLLIGIDGDGDGDGEEFIVSPPDGHGWHLVEAMTSTDRGSALFFVWSRPKNALDGGESTSADAS